MLVAASESGTEPIVRLLLCLLVVLALGRIVGALCKRIGLPVVIGEILAGIALGPSLLGQLPGDLDERLFPAEILPFLDVVAKLGLVLFMFIVGLEVDMDIVRRSGRRAVAISLTSIAVPFLLGLLVLATYLDGDEFRLVPQPGGGAPALVDFFPFGFFLGVAMCGTAFAVLARILAERDMFKIPLGMLLVACAAIDDIVAFSLLATATAIASGSSLSNVVPMLGLLALFVAVLAVVVRPLLERFVAAKYRATGKLAPEQLAILLIGLLASAYITSIIGVHELIGAFLFGAIVPRRNTGQMFHSIAERLEGVSVQLLLPVFFVIAGQKVRLDDFSTQDILPTLVVLAIASFGKFAGGTVAARLTGVPRRQAYAVGTLMNTRGLAELVILQVGRDAGVINDRVYTMLVIMAIVTTAMAGPLLRIVYPDKWLHRDIAEAERNGTVGERDRVVVLLGDGQDVDHLIDAAIGFCGTEAEITLIRFVPATSGFADVADALAETDALRTTIRAQGIDCAVVCRAASDEIGETLREVARLAPDVVIGGRLRPELIEAVRREGSDVVEVTGPLPEDGPLAAPAGSSNAERALLEFVVRTARRHRRAVQVDAGGRVLKALRTAGIEVVRDGGAASLPLTVHPGARDRIALDQVLGRLDATTVVEPLSSR